ncbi:hypothetical protein ACFPES_27300 [Paenibacillus sp. GCM10023248]|uniref:hypothetical protein n=1 Tax=Bacillales TaxID=1385 RepID=UPI002377E203|nr:MULTISPECIES: hypothetical protein [Bacillales]MDD9270771.1 hypothetical protein [Paenibacillus sp. MAHUQ-63]MDR6883315.1 hypothetical protein [Bacillus sp. 3255]
MDNGQTKEAVRHFSLSDDVFRYPGLDIYTQMTVIVLKCFSSESNFPELAEIAKLGRMNVKQVSKALQTLVEMKIISQKIFRRLVGDFQDDRLSWAAKGLLAFCKEHPQIQLDDLIEMSSESGEDETSIRMALRELYQFGYLDEYPVWSQIAN